MTACPIRYQRQVPDRKGKIFYTSITSLSHISKVSGNQAAHGWRWCGADRHDPHPSALRSARLIRQPRRSNHRGGCWKRHSPFTIHQRFKEEIQVWHLSIRQLRFSRRLLLPSVRVLRCGVLSTSWKATATTTPALMLIYGKEATTQIENSVPYYSVSKWSSNTKMLLLHFHAP